MQENFIMALNRIVMSILEDVEGYSMNDDTLDYIANELSAKITPLYEKFSYIPVTNIDRNFVKRLISLLEAAGVLEVRAEHDDVADEVEVAANAPQEQEVSESGGVPDFNTFDAAEWASFIFEKVSTNTSILYDRDYLTSIFANAIMAGYDKAKQEEYPVEERSREDYVYVEFYNTFGSFGEDVVEEVEATFAFNTLAAAQEFVKLNAFGEKFKSSFYRYYTLQQTTTYQKKIIN